MIVMGKVILSMSFVVVAMSSLHAEKEVWYNALGEPVKVIEVVAPKVEKKSVVPLQPSTALEYQSSLSKKAVQRYRTGYLYPQYYPYHTGRYYKRSSHRPLGFRGSYRRNGWSIRLSL